MSTSTTSSAFLALPLATAVIPVDVVQLAARPATIIRAIGSSSSIEGDLRVLASSSTTAPKMDRAFDVWQQQAEQAVDRIVSRIEDSDARLDALEQAIDENHRVIEEWLNQTQTT